MNREQLLENARECVTGQRAQDYGKVEDNFGTIAQLWGGYLDKTISCEDVAALMVLLKVARIKGGSTDDSWVDVAGYAACGAECKEAM